MKEKSLKQISDELEFWDRVLFVSMCIVVTSSIVGVVCKVLALIYE